MLLHSAVKEEQIYNLEIRDIKEEFKFNVEVNKLEEGVLLEIPNPDDREIQKLFYHLKDIPKRQQY